MTYKDKIRAINALMNVPPSFTSGDWFRANVSIEKLALPAIIYLPERQGKLTIRPLQAIRNPLITLAFMDKIEFADNHESIEIVTEAMHLLAYEWLQRAVTSNYFHEPVNITYEEYVDVLDVNLAGVGYTFELKERQGVNLCDLT